MKQNVRIIKLKLPSYVNKFEETIEVEGTEYPLVKLEISRTSHPYYTGQTKLVDSAGRIDKFKNKYAKFKKK